MAGKVSRLVLAVISKETREVVERWQFDVALDNQKPSTPFENDEEAKENQPPR
jgi:mitotic spindle assembly checkpoint protein MAD2